MSAPIAFFLGVAFMAFLVVVWGIVAMASREEAKQEMEAESRERRAARMRWTPPTEPDEAEASGC